MIVLCHEVIASRSKFDKIHPRLCQLPQGHEGKHIEFPCLLELASAYPSVATKIARDAYMTTGAAWKSEDAGPNRILRWVMLQSNADLLAYGINMANLKPQVVAKLREKAATYEHCVEVAKWLTWLVYQMPDAPVPSLELRAYLEAHFETMNADSTVCLICREPLSFTLFANAVRGRAHIETGHANPRSHTAANVGFAHRECNIAQGSKSLAEFYIWIEQILQRVQGG